MKTLIVPAAGMGSRLDANLPKALVKVHDTPLIEYIFAAAASIFESVVVVVNPGSEGEIREWCGALDYPFQIDICVQTEATGSLDAVLIGLRSASKRNSLSQGAVVVWCDQIGVAKNTLEYCASQLNLHRNIVVIPCIMTETPYVWIESSAQKLVTRIGRVRDGDLPPPRGLADLGVFGVGQENIELLLDSVQEPNSMSGEGRERDFTYSLVELSRMAQLTDFYLVDDSSQLLSVNTPDQLLVAERQIVDD